MCFVLCALCYVLCVESDRIRPDSTVRTAQFFSMKPHFRREVHIDQRPPRRILNKKDKSGTAIFQKYKNQPRGPEKKDAGIHECNKLLRASKNQKIFLKIFSSSSYNTFREAIIDSFLHTMTTSDDCADRCERVRSHSRILRRSVFLSTERFSIARGVTMASRA